MWSLNEENLESKNIFYKKFKKIEKRFLIRINSELLLRRFIIHSELSCETISCRLLDNFLGPLHSKTGRVSCVCNWLHHCAYLLILGNYNDAMSRN